MPSRSERSQQRKRARELRKAMAELDRLARPPRRSRQTDPRRQLVLTVVITALVLVALVVLAPTAELAAARRLVGLGPDQPGAPAGPGHYAFLHTQAQTGAPTGYDPCRVIRLQVNPDGAPEGYERLVDTAIEHTEGATGLRFEQLGETDRRPDEPATDRRVPVLVAWATADEVPRLAGKVAGVGGSTWVTRGFRHAEYVTGTVVLDSDVFDDVRGDDYAAAQSIVDHEFGHLVGLAHVDDPGELMYDKNIGRRTYGPGDLKGLAILGNLPCSKGTRS